MKPLSPVKPSATFSHLFPSQTVFMPHSTTHFIRWVCDEASFRLKSITGFPFAVMGTMPLICHQNVATPLILDFFHHAGLEPPTNIETYETEEEAVALAQQYRSRNKKLAYIYPPPLSVQESGGLLVPIDLYNWLNDKANLAHLVEADYLPSYRIVPVDCLSQLHDFLPGQTVFIKACHPGASGAGKDVFFCPDESRRANAVEWLASRIDDLSGIRIEEAVEIDSCWCLNLAILESAVRYLGAATQLFSEPAKQCGSRIDPSDLPPDSIIAIALTIADRARVLGYRGVAGFDMGITQTGQPFVFDLNFRLAASTPQVLLHKAAVRRVDARISQSWSCTVNGALAPALERIAEFSQNGKFLPVRLYDTMQQNGGQSLITGMVVAFTIDEVESIIDSMQKKLSDLL